MLRLVAEGLTGGQIATELKTHILRLFRNSGVESLVSTAMPAMRHGLM